MCDHNKEKLAQEPSSDSMKTGSLPEQHEKEVQVKLQSKPSAKPDHKIQPRQFIPPVPQGKDIPDDTPSPPVELD